MQHNAIVAILACTVCGSALGAAVETCDGMSVTSGKSFRVDGSDQMLHAGPNATSAKLINQKATSILGSTQYLAIDHTVQVIEDCTKGGWSRVRVTEPEWLRTSHVGWVPSKILRGEQIDVSGRRVFTEADFVWDKAITPYKNLIVTGVNQVYNSDARCAALDPGSAYISKSKGTPINPVFFVTCGTGANAVNVFFSKSDVEQRASSAR